MSESTLRVRRLNVTAACEVVQTRTVVLASLHQGASKPDLASAMRPCGGPGSEKSGRMRRLHNKNRTARVCLPLFPPCVARHSHFLPRLPTPRTWARVASASSDVVNTERMPAEVRQGTRPCVGGKRFKDVPTLKGLHP